MKLIITVEIPVESPEAGQQKYQQIKDKLADNPDIILSGHITEKTE